MIETANAKVTLSLRITGVRADGYHELDALVVCTDSPSDRLDIDLSARGLTVVPPGAAPVDDSNIVARALRLLELDAAVTITKTIPTEAGLGGGSADAAAVVRALAPSVAPSVRSRLDDIAARLGADVPVCLARRPARMRGIGEQVDLLPELPPVHLLIATPSFGCSTPAVYRAWDELGGPVGDRAVPPPLGWEAQIDELVNDLEPAAVVVEPRLAMFRDALTTVIGAEPLLCGSGSSYAAWFSNRAEADEAAVAVRASGLRTRYVGSASSL